MTISPAVKPKKSEVYGSIEGLIQDFELIMSNRGWKAPIAEAYGAHETANWDRRVTFADITAILANFGAVCQ